MQHAANFILPEPAHFSLVQLRDYARLMARITEQGSHTSILHPDVRADAFSLSYAHIAQDLDAVLDAASYADAAPAPDASPSGERKQKKRSKR